MKIGNAAGADVAAKDAARKPNIAIMRGAIPGIPGSMIDLAGTQFRDGLLLLSEAFKSRRIVQWWEPQGNEFHYKIVARGLTA